MNPTRFKILLGVAAVLAVAILWNWISGWGLVTVHVQGESVAKVIKSIERQGGIRIITNADVAAKITMDVDRVPPVDAVDVLAARLDANWTVGYVAGPSKAEVAAGLAGVAQDERNREFRSFGLGGGGFGGGGLELSTPVDSRLVEWKVSASDPPQLQSYLDQLSQKTGLMAVVPESWNPSVAQTPSGGPAGPAIKALVRSVGGQAEEVFLIRLSNWDRTAEAGREQNQTPGRPRTDGNWGGPPRDGNADRGGGPDRGGGRRDFHPEWMAERAEARLAQLPVAEREQARKDFDEMRAMMEKLRALPEDQRRAEMEKLFNNPAVQERMAERMAERDEKSGPEQRAERSRRYIQRKQAMQQNPDS